MKVTPGKNVKPREESFVYNLRTRGYNLRTRPTMAAARQIHSFRYYTIKNVKPREESFVYNLRTRGYNLRTRPTMAAARQIHSFRYYTIKLQVTESRAVTSSHNCIWTLSIIKNHDPDIGKNKSHPEPHLTVANNNGHHRVYGWNRNIIIDDVREEVAIMIESRHGGCRQCNKIWLEIKCGNFRAFVPLVLI
jgi:hypothetical protein